MRDIIIIGGGLSGLVSAILLKRSGRDVVLIEKKKYPFHRVCGEYISNEVRSFLQANGLLPEIGFQEIDTFALSSIRGQTVYTKLDLGGFGISRYNFDHYLYQVAKSENVVLHTGEKVESIRFEDDFFLLKTTKGKTFNARVAIGAYGKRSNLDNALDRSFFSKRSPYLGIKYHAISNHDARLIALHNFEGGYCGVNCVENGITNICYLSKRENLKKYGNIAAMEENVLFKNPQLKQLFNDARILFDKPEVINEISFETKKPVEKHILMCGDAAGMIAPLCGNGMAMAIHSAKVASEIINAYFTSSSRDRLILEDQYSANWSRLFKKRLWIGRQVQKLFGNHILSNMSVSMVNHMKPLGRFLIKNTHGEPI